MVLYQFSVHLPVCVLRETSNHSTTLFNCLIYCYHKFLPIKYLKNLIYFATLWFLWSSTWVFPQESPRSEGWSFWPCPVTLILSESNLRIWGLKGFSWCPQTQDIIHIQEFKIPKLHRLPHCTLRSPLHQRTSLSPPALVFKHPVTFTVILRPFPIKCFPCGSAGQESACSVGDLGSIPGLEDPLEKGKATHSSILAWQIAWTVSSMGILSLSFSYQIAQAVKLYGQLLESCLLHWPTREKSLLTGELESGTKIFWDHRGHGNSLQYTCLENPMDRGVWHAIVHGVAQSQTQLKQLSMHADHV